MVAPSKAFAFFGRRHIEWVKYWEMPSPKTSLFTTPWLAKMLWWWGNEIYGLSVGGKYWQMSTPKTFPSIAVEQKSERSQESAILDKSHFPHHYIYSCQNFPLEWKSWSPTDLFNKYSSNLSWWCEGNCKSVLFDHPEIFDHSPERLVWQLCPYNFSKSHFGNLYNFSKSHLPCNRHSPLFDSTSYKIYQNLLFVSRKLN